MRVVRILYEHPNRLIVLLSSTNFKILKLYELIFLIVGAIDRLPRICKLNPFFHTNKRIADGGHLYPWGGIFELPR